MSAPASKRTPLLYEARRAGAFKIGGCVIKEQRRGYSAGQYSHHSRRLREIEALIELRHGGQVPETDDPSYIEAAAYAMNARIKVLASRGISRELDTSIHGWCSMFAPWALPRAGEIIRPIINRLEGRVHDLDRQTVSRLLCVKLSEYNVLRFSSLAPVDLPWEMFQKLTKGIKRRKDRERQTAKRRDAGVMDRQQWLAKSLSKTRPWEAEGVSRRTWERRRKAKSFDDAGPSPVGVYILPSDTPATRASTVAGGSPTLNPSSLSLRILGADSVNGAAEPSTSSTALPADVCDGEVA